MEFWNVAKKTSVQAYVHEVTRINPDPKKVLPCVGSKGWKVSAGPAVFY